MRVLCSVRADVHIFLYLTNTTSKGFDNNGIKAQRTMLGDGFDDVLSAFHIEYCRLVQQSEFVDMPDAVGAIVSCRCSLFLLFGFLAYPSWKYIDSTASPSLSTPHSIQASFAYKQASSPTRDSSAVVKGLLLRMQFVQYTSG